MENNFERVNSIINRLRDVLKCQKCLQLKQEDSMLFYHLCDHFYCTDCVAECKSCQLCGNTHDEWDKVVNDKNILSLYQSLSKFELPSKKDVEEIYKNHKKSKELFKSSEVESKKEVEETPKNHLRGREKNSNIKTREKQIEKKTPTESEKVKEIISTGKKGIVMDYEIITSVAGRGRGESSSTGKETVIGAENITPVVGRGRRESASTGKETVIGAEKITPVAGRGRGESASTGKKGTVLDSENVTPVVGRGGGESALTGKKGAVIDSKNVTPVTGKGKQNTTPSRRNVTPVLQRNSTPLAGGSKGNSSVTKTNINKRNPKGETQLHIACKKSNIGAVEELIAAGGNPNTQDNAGWTPLHESVFSGNIEVINFLLDHGAKVNAPGLENTTALHEAIAKGNVNIVKLLLKYGADINAMNMFRETPLDLVTKYKLTEMKEILLESKSNVKMISVVDSEETEQKMVIYKHNLLVEDEKLVNKFVEKFNLPVISSVTLKDPPTHIIVSSPRFEITMAIISSVFAGSWVVTINWVKDSLNEEAPKPASQYEPSNPCFPGFAKARANRHSQLPGLFSGCHFFFGGYFESYTLKNITIKREDLKLFVEKQGGKILRRNPNPESLALEKTVPYHAPPTSSLRDTAYYIIYEKDFWNPNPRYNMSHMKSLPFDWLICCVLKFELVDPKGKDSPFCNFL